MYRVKLIPYGKQETIETFNDIEKFEEYYFRLLRNANITAYGSIDGINEFAISNSIEICDHRARLFSISPENWVQPTPEQFKGILAQFNLKKDFCKLLGVSRASVANWQKTGGIDFYRWSFLLTFLGIRRTFTDLFEVDLK